MQRVAELVRRASKDTGVIAALRNDPSQLPKSLDLSEEHMNALQSASAFVVPPAGAKRAAKPAATSLSFGQRAMAATVAPDGTLLPPEGSGGGPAVLTLPPMAPVTAPVAPIPAPIAPIGAPVAKPPVPTPAPVSKPPTAPPPQPPVPVTPPPVTAPFMAPFAPVHSPATDYPPQGRTYDPPQPVQTLVAAVAGCECDCSVAITALVSTVSMTAHTALTALTAIAGSE